MKNSEQIKKESVKGLSGQGLKNYLMIFILSVMLTAFNFNSVRASEEKMPIKESVVSVVKDARARELLSRLEELKSIDKSKLNSSEKKELRKEVKEIKSQLQAINGGVYLSVGAIIIIILLLILLL